jgi:hypothetical protein
MDWQVEVLQQVKGKTLDKDPYQVVPMVNDTVKLRRDKFVLRVRLPRPFTVRLNVLGNDNNFRRIVPGLTIGEVKKKDEHCFSPATGLAEGLYHSFTIKENGKDRVLPATPDSLYLDENAHHHLYYIDEKDHRWNSAIVSGAEAVFERKVYLITNRLDNFESFDGKRLYLTFLVKHREGDIIEADELKKIQLQFE